VSFDTDERFWSFLGFAAGFSTALLLIAITLSLSPQITLTTFNNFLQNWQTLIGAGLALVGALLTVFVVGRQTTLQRQLDAQQRYRKHYAARSAMAAALSEMVEYADSSHEILKVIPKPPSQTGRIQTGATWVAPRLIPNYIPGDGRVMHAYLLSSVVIWL
jgi:hypothetical protein